jgi:hypothetical protein
VAWSSPAAIAAGRAMPHKAAPTFQAARQPFDLRRLGGCDRQPRLVRRLIRLAFAKEQLLEQFMALADGFIRASEDFDFDVTVGEKLDLPPLTRNHDRGHDRIVAVVLEHVMNVRAFEAHKEVEELLQRVHHVATV